MTKTITAILIGLLLVGCTVEVKDSQPSPTTTNATPLTITVPETPPPPVATDEQQYVDDVRSQAPAFADLFTDAELVTFALTICALYESGYTDDQVVQRLYDVGVENNMSDDTMVDSGYAAGAAQRIFCPWSIS